MKSISLKYRFLNQTPVKNWQELATQYRENMEKLDTVLNSLFRHQIDLSKDVTGMLPAGNVGSSGVISASPPVMELGADEGDLGLLGLSTPPITNAGLTAAQVAARISLDLEGLGVPQIGAAGPQGAQGIPGPMGQSQILLLAEDPLDSEMGPPGVQGIQGVAGTSTSEDVFANRGGTGTAGKLFLPDDGFSLARDTGSAWNPFGPLFRFTTPDDTTYSWVNQSTSTSANSKDAAVLTSANAVAADNLYLRVKAAPATPYTITAAFLCYLPFIDYFGYGLCFRDSVSGKIHTGELTSNSSVNVNDLALFSGKYTSATAFSASYTLNASIQKAGPFGKGITWMKIQDDGTNRIWSVSMDGQNWTTLLTVSRTDFLTANQVGYYFHADNASIGNIPLTLLSWKVS